MTHDSSKSKLKRISNELDENLLNLQKKLGLQSFVETTRIVAPVVIKLGVEIEDLLSDKNAKKK